VVLWTADLDGEGDRKSLHFEDLAAELFAEQFEDLLLLVDHVLVDADHSALRQALPVLLQEVLLDETPLAVLEWGGECPCLEVIHLQVLWSFALIGLIVGGNVDVLGCVFIEGVLNLALHLLVLDRVELLLVVPLR
jgi:hypothetical protein